MGLMAGQQEPASNQEIAAFAADKGVQFTMFAKTTVNPPGCTGAGTGCDASTTTCCPANSGVFELLRKGLPNAQRQPLSWNFEKILVGRDGFPLGRFPTNTPPHDIIPQVIPLVLAFPVVCCLLGA